MRFFDFICIFAPWFWKESPMEVCLTALNWERECKSPTVPQQWTPLWLLSNNAIARLDEKALGSGGKSEDQPSIGKMPDALDVRVVLAIRITFFVGFIDSAQHLLCAYVYYYISSQGAVCREDNASPFFKIFQLFKITYPVMNYIIIVALEFVLAIAGVALLIRYYNHKVWKFLKLFLA